MKPIILVILLFVSYQGYDSNQPIKWTEQKIINILEKGQILFCKYDLLLESKDTTFYVKNLYLQLPIIEDIYSGSAYVESSVIYGESKKYQKNMHCTYLVICDKRGYKLEIMEDEFVYLPKLSKYLDDKLKNTKTKEYLQGYLPLDGDN